MALIYDAVLTPGKLEIVAGFLPAQPWSHVPAGAVAEAVASYRFDDPAGAVGIETHLVRVAGDAGTGPVLQVPLTYRDAPLAGAEDSLIATMEHSVLGTRWVYDAVGDPVWAQAVVTAALTGGTHAPLLDPDGAELPLRGIEVRGVGGEVAAPEVTEVTVAPPAVGAGGAVTEVRTPVATIRLVRVVGTPPVPLGAALQGWFTDGTSVVLAGVER